ncbi:MAG: sensor histidine kinase [Clostridiales bacterium]|nr:sensor histidine kinase [Clostridiales bacterium]MBS5878183.1 sensor histidine kinase [Clostridiales bacterium]
MARSFIGIAKTQDKACGIDIENGLTLKGDENSINKLVSILLDNAFKYSPAGGSIFISLKKIKNNIVLKVENSTDKSLDKEDLLHFFDRFYRSDRSRNSAKKGYGIGLSVARAITDNHKGKIDAYSKDPRYLIVEASFPLN